MSDISHSASSPKNDQHHSKVILDLGRGEENNIHSSIAAQVMGWGKTSDLTDGPTKNVSQEAAQEEIDPCSSRSMQA